MKKIEKIEWCHDHSVGNQVVGKNYLIYENGCVQASMHPFRAGKYRINIVRRLGDK